MTIADSKGRTRNYLRQITGGAFYKVGAIIASFLSIPLMIGYLGEEQFGIWATLLSVLSWFVFFDFGIGNGLRNKVAELNAKGKMEEAASYIGSGYILLGLVAFFIWIIVSVAAYWLPWNLIFNTNAIAEDVLRETIQIIVFSLALNFWIGLVSCLIGAVQKTSLIAFGQLISNLFVLTVVFFLSKFSEASIRSLAVVYGVSIIISSVVLNIWFFYTHPELRPNFKSDNPFNSQLIKVGINFFIIQLAVLLIFTTDKILITHLFGPRYVTQYESVFKIFSIFTFFHGLITTPLWSSYTDAYYRKDFEWIKKLLLNQVFVFFAICLGAISLALSARWVLELWIGEVVEYNVGLVWSIFALTVVTMWNNIFSIFLNGVNKIFISLRVSMVCMFLNVPISIFLAKNTELGVGAVVVGTVIVLTPGAFLGPIQTHKILNNKDKGIWSK